jgi:hypothetical protein
VPAMTSEGPCRGELSQLMADHILGNIHGDKPLSIMDGDCMADQFGKDHGAAGPCPDDSFLRSTIHGHDSLQQFPIDKRPLL